MRRDLQGLSIMRSLAIVLIVVCHLQFFLDAGVYNSYLLAASSYASFIGLGVFFFISGFGLYHSNRDLPDLMGFYKKRSLRIYPLYWFALGITSLHDSLIGKVAPFTITTSGSHMLAITLLGLQGFYPNYGGIFWFIGVILIYYLLYPILIYPEKMDQMLVFHALLFAILTVVTWKLCIVPTYLWYYYWAFVSGILVSKAVLEYDRLPEALPGLFTAIFILSSFLFFASCLKILNIPFAHSLSNTLIPLSASIVLYSGLQQHPITSEILNKIAFSSFAVYLLHGLILSTLMSIIKYYNLMPWTVLIMLPIVFVISYYIQRAESHFSNRYHLAE